MKTQTKLLSYSIISFSLFLIALFLYTNQTSPKAATNIIKQSYTVKEVHPKYIVAEPNKYKDELINFYYDDQTKKQSFNINDKVAAYFKPYKNDYQIVDFKKVN